MARERFETPAPIESWFVARRIPQGEAPLFIREQWIGIPLPVRYERPIEAPDPVVGKQIFTRRAVITRDAVRIETDDAIRALALFNRMEGAVWWDELRRQGLIKLIFDLQWGDWLSTDVVQREFPQIKDFDKDQK